MLVMHNFNVSEEEEVGGKGGGRERWWEDGCPPSLAFLTTTVRGLPIASPVLSTYKSTFGL